MHMTSVEQFYQDCSYQVAFLCAFDEVADFYRSQLITSETRRGIVVATALEVDKASNCLSTIAATTMMFLHNRDYQRYALLEGTTSQYFAITFEEPLTKCMCNLFKMDAEVRNSLLKEPTLHDAIKIAVTYRKQELLQLEEQNNDPAEPEVVIVEDDEVVIEPVPKKKRTGNKGFTIPEELGRGGANAIGPPPPLRTPPTSPLPPPLLLFLLQYTTKKI
uniref:Uncharacterized protein n=1 Tax=Oryza nivara TaxID=4536 RepID=A0A0E0G5H2_ORYNI